MRCKKHLQDLTSTVGVCASCLYERLQPILEAQAQAQAQVHVRAQPSRLSVSEMNLQSSQPDFPRSVSPYVSRRNTDDRRREILFQTTPQVDHGGRESSKRRIKRFWMISNLFSTRSKKTENSSHGSCEPSSSATPPLSTWLSTVVNPLRQNNRVSDQGRRGQLNRGMSPVDNFERDRSDIGFSSESSPQQQKSTAITARRSKLGYAGKSLTSMALCLSPLVRASPNRQWNSHKRLSQELGVGGVHHISSAASFCANRSKKLVDLGRVTHKR